MKVENIILELPASCFIQCGGEGPDVGDVRFHGGGVRMPGEDYVLDKFTGWEADSLNGRYK